MNQDKIREMLNKLTNNNYNELSEEIINNLQHFIYMEGEAVLLEFGKSIFEISSINKFWVKLYAKLYNKLIDKFPIMKNICLEQFKNFMNIFDKFEIGNENDYDSFCKINKDNEKRRSLVYFYVELYKHDILGNNEVELIMNRMFDLMGNNDNNDIIEEIFENINIVLTEIDIIGEQIGDEIQERLLDFYNKFNDKKMSKKLKFKFLDLFEELDIDFD